MRNVGRLLSNLKFDSNMENRLMSDILDKGMQPDAAVRAWRPCSRSGSTG